MVRKVFSTGQEREAPRGIAPALFYGLVGALMLTNALTGVALVVSPDIGRHLGAQADTIISAYEDRITQMRIEIDRLHSRSFAQAGGINIQLQELAAQQEMLLEQHGVVEALVGRARAIGLEPEAMAPSAVDVSALDRTGNEAVDETALSLATMMAETEQAMSSITETAERGTQAIRAELAGLGVPLSLPMVTAGIGGPLLAPRPGERTVLSDANLVLASLERFGAARAAIAGLPVSMPIGEAYRRSSGFGNRVDPFTGGRAFHAGLDFAAPTGTPVKSAGTGIVVFAGTRSGYGKMIELRHENGLTTRYAHLSMIFVARGDAVVQGDRIGEVGSTGRSTGPHLHFEVRRGDDAIDPRRFLDAGQRLGAFI